MDIREVFARNLRRIRHAKGLSREALAHEADMELYQLARARNVQREHRDGRKTCGCAGYCAARIAAAPVEAEAKQIRKRRSRVTITIEPSAPTICVACSDLLQRKTTDEVVSLKRLSCTMAEGHLVITTPAYWAARSEVTAMTSVGAENGAQFMGFRDCAVCGETLFAAERAVFVCADRVVLHWCCDSCGHRFQTIADTGRKPPARAA